jgi:hypothetical protein
LDVFKCEGLGVLSDDFMDKALQNGEFSNTEHFKSERNCGGTFVYGHCSADVEIL